MGSAHAGSVYTITITAKKKMMKKMKNKRAYFFIFAGAGGFTYIPLLRTDFLFLFFF